MIQTNYVLFVVIKMLVILTKFIHDITKLKVKFCLKKIRSICCFKENEQTKQKQYTIN